ncbi:MAG: glycosyltransferase family 2 protein [Methylotenera sp.]|nr:glycosyltransferase family 2 protein [Flavobacterium sp.]
MLAIVIPFYKLTFFDATLSSLANQTDKRFKVYIGDDSSPENPEILLIKNKEHFCFDYKKFETNLGRKSLVQQWNRCIAMIKNEEWVMVLGDDDVLGQNAVAEFYKHLNQFKNAKVIRYATCKIDAKGRSTSELYTHPVTESATDFLFRKTRSSLSEFIFSTVQLRKFGFQDFPLAWYSDILAVLEFAEFKTIYSINEATVYVRISNLSISGSSDNLWLKTNAEFKFHNYLLTRKQVYFTALQQEILFKRLNNCFIYNKRHFALFFKISRTHLINFSLLRYLDFIKSIFNAYFNKNHANRIQST